ncbi:S8 family serine peptidase [uncultured Tateyamaria sp.]|uniref:S8 family serine peptidase n=1 Tax=uncultured Tateyamaria sp. TaxID=455651 RepID=UPI002624F50F|nr:S8 family serine peptidase [uncultured Tateyamaria sp.]
MTKKPKKKPAPQPACMSLSSSVDELLADALKTEPGAQNTGRTVLTFKDGANGDMAAMFQASGARVADARDYVDQSVDLSQLSDADVLMLPEINVAVMTPRAVEASAVGEMSALSSDSPIASIDPEHFVHAIDKSSEFMRGFLQATRAIAEGQALLESEPDLMVEAEASGVTWGLAACKVPESSRSGAGIKVAVLDTGLDFGHPDFVGRRITGKSFVGGTEQDGNGHGTHCIGTACGPQSPTGPVPRYGIGYGAQIYVGKVLADNGSSVGTSVLLGMNWAIANRCEVISMSLGGRTSTVYQPYVRAGQRALDNGLLMIAATGNQRSLTAAPANSPTIMAVASLDPNLKRSNFSNYGKVEIAAPGRDVLSSAPRPELYREAAGTSMATPHVAGCAALWAQTDPRLRGKALWDRLQRAARPLSEPAKFVGSGLVQAPS